MESVFRDGLTCNLTVYCILKLGGCSSLTTDRSALIDL